MSLVKIVSIQTSWQVLTKIFTTISGIIILLILTRSYSSADVGVYTLALTYLSFFYLFGDFGLNTHTVPELVQENSHLAWRKLLGLRILLGLALSLVSIAFLPALPFKSSNFNLAVILGAISILGSCLSLTSLALFQAKLTYQYSTIISFITTSSTTLLTLFFVFNNYPIYYLMVGPVLGWCLGFLVSLIFVKKFFTYLGPIFELGNMKMSIFSVYPFALTLVLNTIYFRIDSFIITTLKTFSEVGIYNLSYQIFQTFLVIPTFFMNSLYPVLIKQKKEDKNIFYNSLRRVTLFLSVVSILLTLIVVFFADIGIQLLTKENLTFSGSANSLKLLAVGFPAFFLSSLFMWLMVIYKKYFSLLIVYSIGFIINITLNLLLIPNYSYLGAAVVTVISEYLILLMQIFIVYKRIYKWT